VVARGQSAPIPPAPGSLEGLIPSWERGLRAANKSPKTIRTYGDDARLLLEYLTANGLPTTVDDLKKEHVEHFIADQLDRHKPTTAAVRYRSLQQLFKWLVVEGEIPASPMATMQPPKVPEIPVPVVADADLKKLLKACEGRGFDELRDTAIIRLLLDTGVRLAEVTNLNIENLDLDLEVIHVMGKGRRPRSVPFGRKTGQAIDRYLRSRSRHRLASSAALWVGGRGTMTESGIAQMLERRCDQAGIDRIHPHQLRHTAAHAWLAAGGSEGDAMRLMGWKSREMLGRYGAAQADQRAHESFRRLLPGDRV
jgi:site-specific recombinase XerD